MIVILDYGMGNLASVFKAFKYLGEDALVTRDRNMIKNASALVLPGVGAIGDAMKALDGSGLSDEIRNFVITGKPFLGICLGMQMLFEKSSEGKEDVRGLGILKGHVEKLPDTEGVKIPHMGWNSLCSVGDSILPEEGQVYFVHSYHVVPESHNVITSVAYHGVKFVASVRQNNIRATQFHPEKSGDTGIEILKKWTYEYKKGESNV